MRELKPAVVVGNDALTESVCRNLSADGWQVTVVWSDEPGLRARIEACGAAFVAQSPLEPEALRAAGIAEARTLLALDEDDRVNLEVALEARDANPDVRIVLRQFNLTLARKIEENLPNCSVISLAAHSAATYAAAAIDPEIFFAAEFPAGSRSLIGFSRRSAREAAIAGYAVSEAEQRLGCRVLATDGSPYAEAARLGGDEPLVLAGPVEELARYAAPLQRAGGGFGWAAVRARAIAAEFDPLLRVLVVAGAALFLAATAYFAAVLHLSPVTAAYFVTTTMTTVGYGDIALRDNGPLTQVVGMTLMAGGIIISNLAIGFVAAALIRAQWNSLQGMRPIRHTGHVIVFGAGRVGTRVVDFLCKLNAIVTVVELHPAPELVARARAREISLLTGDGALDETIDLSNVRAARCAVVVTDSDATNLEIGLGARARRSGIPVIMRIAQPRFASAIRKQFEIRRAFSVTALASSAFSDLASSDAARGRVRFDGTTYRLEERICADADRAAIPLAAARRGARARAVTGWDAIEPDERVLTITR